MVLGHEGKQSLYALLQSRGWVSSFDAAVTEENSLFVLLGLSAELTEIGLERKTLIGMNSIFFSSVQVVLNY